MPPRMEKRRIANGQVVEVPAGLTAGGRRDYVLQNYQVQPQDIDPSWVPESAGEMNRFTQFSAGLQNWLSERGLNPRGDAGPTTPMWQNHLYGGPVARPPDGGYATAGRMAVPLAAGGAVSMIPGAQGIGSQMALQGLTQGGLELMRDDATAWDATKTGGAAAVGTWGGSMIGRWLSGWATNASARLRGEAVAFPKGNRNTLWQNTAKFSGAAGGLNSVVKTQIRAMNNKIGKVFGITDDLADDIDEAFLVQARNHVNGLYQQAQPNAPVDISKVRSILTDLVENQGVKSAKINKFLEITSDTLDPRAYQSAHRTLRDIGAEMRNDTMYRMLADYADDAVTAMDKAGLDAGADKALLGAANQKYKFLETLEEIDKTLVEGEVPAGQLIRLMRRDNYKGFGKRLVAEGAGRDRIVPEILDVLDTGKTVADFTRRTFGGSPTAGREAGIAPMFRTLGDLVNPEANFGPSVSRLVSTTAARAPGLAAVGSPVAGRVVGGVGAAAGAETERRKQLIPDLFVPSIDAP